MAIAILNRLPSKITPYDKWLEMVDDDIILFTSSNTYSDYIDNEFYKEVRGYDNYEYNYHIEKDILKLNEKYKFSSIVIISECDIIRAGKLRTVLGIEGQNLTSAYCFRDKILMKQLARECDVNTPIFERLYNKKQLFTFCRENGFPVILKPILESGSKGLIVIENMSNLNAVITMNREIFDGTYEVETFIIGQVYHTDGIVANYNMIFCAASKYHSDCLAFKNNKVNSSYTLPKESQLREKLIHETEKLLNNMPKPRNLVFHAEFIVDKKGKIFLCEIASRTAAGRTNDVIKHKYQVDLNKYLVLGQCGLEFEVQRYESDFLFGDILIMDLV